MPRNREYQAHEAISLGQQGPAASEWEGITGLRKDVEGAVASAISMEMPVFMLFKPPAQFPGYG